MRDWIEDEFHIRFLGSIALFGSGSFFLLFLLKGYLFPKKWKSFSMKNFLYIEV